MPVIRLKIMKILIKEQCKKLFGMLNNKKKCILFELFQLNEYLIHSNIDLLSFLMWFELFKFVYYINDIFTKHLIKFIYT